MVRKVLTAQDPRLRHKSKPVIKIDKKILKLLEDMHDTLKIQKDPEGVGLAAPQIGEFYQIFLMQDNKKIIPVFNPKIIKLSKKTNDPSARKARSGQVPSDEYIVFPFLIIMARYKGLGLLSWNTRNQNRKTESGYWRINTK